jgi:hypothetical protein
MGTPQLTADGYALNIGARVWYTTANSTLTDFQMLGGEVVGIKSQSISIQAYQGFCDKKPGELFATPEACLASKVDTKAQTEGER